MSHASEVSLSPALAGRIWIFSQGLPGCFCPKYMKERIVIIFIAVTLGLLVTTIGFFLYESSKPSKPVDNKVPTKNATRPALNDEITLTVTSPQNESLTSNRTIQVKGKTDPQNVIIISTNEEDTVVSPTESGDFTASLSIDTGVNKLIVEAVAPNGNNKKDVRVISFSSGNL